MRKWLILVMLAAASVRPELSFAQDRLPFDPVMGLSFRPNQIKFEQAPSSLVAACTQPARSMFWIYAQVSRPEGEYIVIAGPTWTTPDSPGAKPVLEPVDSYGEVVLVHEGKCTPFADPDTLFGAPSLAQKALVEDLSKDLIARAVRAYGSKAKLQAALKAQGLTPDKLDPVLLPFIYGPASH